jgi:hypothetical protein
MIFAVLVFGNDVLGWLGFEQIEAIESMATSATAFIVLGLALVAKLSRRAK